MKLIKLIICLIMLCLFSIVDAQENKKQISIGEYIETYKLIAIKNMQDFKIPASITLAQGILESANGNSELAINANNHFGIKCTSDWTGKTYLKDDDKKDDCFRVYVAALDSYTDHSIFIKNRPRYAGLFLLNINDYKAWAKGLKDAGYATNPKYPELLIKIIEDNKLYELDNNTQTPVFIATTVSNSPQSDAKEDFEVISISNNNRKVFSNNNIKFVLVKKGDTFKSIADDFEMKPGEIYRYNDFQENYTLKEGEKVYLQPKRRKGSAEFHMVTPDDTFLSISQQYGIKLKHLLKKNNLEKDAQIQPGDKLWLQERKPKS
ncbi:MAG: glucosaminidase domain-containing protein [Bacteroidetes bacterium]|nr:glucosaminidase domain-containing protein [Bacteroidota bacterium]